MMKKLDKFTVEAVQLTAPGACPQDREKLHGMLEKGHIFEAFSTLERERIWREVLAVSVDRLIPSLHSFFADLNYLQGPAECIKQLYDSPHDLMHTTLKHYFSDKNQQNNTCIVQISESKFVTRPGSATDRLDLGYRQIWLSAMREYKCIPPRPKKVTRDVVAKPTLNENELASSRFANLAYRLGFETNQIRKLAQRSGDREIARNALLKARNQKQFLYDSSIFEESVQSIVKFFNLATEIPVEEEANMVSKVRYLHDPRQRCGLPRDRDYQDDRSVLFLDRIHDGKRKESGITPFFVRRSVYLAFFGPFYATNGNISMDFHEDIGGSISECDKRKQAQREQREQAELEVRERAEVKQSELQTISTPSTAAVVEQTNWKEPHHAKISVNEPHVRPRLRPLFSTYSSAYRTQITLSQKFALIS